MRPQLKAVSEATPPPEGPLARKRIALSLCAVAAVVVLIRLAMPVGFGLFLGALLAFFLQPIYERLLDRGWRASLAALMCSVGLSAVLAAILFGLGYLIVSELLVLARILPQELAPGGSLHESVTRLSDAMRARNINPDEQMAKVQQQLAPKAASLAAALPGVAGQLVLFFIMMTMANFNILLRWRKLVAWAQRDLPLDPAHTRRLFREFQQVGRHVVVGTIVTGLAQGAVGGIVCWVTGVPKPAFFGAVTAFLSPIPVFGSLVVWAGVGIFRVATGHVAAGIAELVLGALFVGVLMDDFVRPKLVGGGKKFPVILTFIGLLGGVAVFGVTGLIVGPIVVALCVAILKIYNQGSEKGADDGDPVESS
jgi:predicted PurR-regulated permease PerM